MDQQQLTNLVLQLQSEIQSLRSLLVEHQHDDIDGTKTLRKSLRLDEDQGYVVGPGGIQATKAYSGVSGDVFSLGIAVGEDNRIAKDQRSPNAQLTLDHYPSQSLSFFYGLRKPLITNLPDGARVATTSAGTTVTINGFNFVTNELAGALINIFDSSGSLVETRTIASNTSTVVTISGAWGASTSNAFFLIYHPILLGRDFAIWNRLYVQEGTSVGGVRFGVGPTAGGQNGLLYMDSAGDLYWRNKAGSAVKLN